MEDNIEIVKTYYEKLALEGPVEGTNQSISEDFKLIAGTLEIDRKGFIAILTRLYAAIPDLTHTLSDIQVRGESVQLTDHPAGTFTGTWDGTSFGLPIVPPNGDAFLMAPMKWEITVRNGKITRWHDVTIPSGTSGLPGFLKALGSSMPAAKPWNA
jgi:predicted ester cyclase